MLERGLRRSDQDRQALLYIQSYLELRQAIIAMDSAARDSATALRAIRAATHSALERQRLVNPPSRPTPWLVPIQQLGTMQSWHAEYARDLGLYAESLAADDSAETHWANALQLARNIADTSTMETSLKGVVRAFRSRSFTHLAQRNYAGAVAFAQLARDSARALIQLRSSVDNESFYLLNLHTLGHRYEDADQLSAADSTFRTAVRLDSAMIVHGRGPEGPVASEMEDVIRDNDRVIGKRIATDTAGKIHEQQIALMRAGEERRRPLRETQVWLRRRSLDRLRDQSARDSLSISLSNLSWTYLLTDRPEQAVDAARESASINPRETWELPNWFNAVLLSGNDEQAAALFHQNVARLVEDPKVPFPCAVLRDIRELARRGIATERHVRVVEGLVTAQQTQCQNPTSSPTP
jgi:tetratricopeptide (TPR) repeat protein